MMVLFLVAAIGFDLKIAGDCEAKSSYYVVRD